MINAAGDQSTQKLELRATWQNSGKTTIHIVKAEIEFFDNNGDFIERYQYPIYVAPGWEFGKPDNADVNSGVAPGSSYTDPPGSGHLLLPRMVDARLVTPTTARIARLYVVQ